MSNSPRTDALMDKHFTNQPSAKLTVAYGVLHAHACQLESSLAEAVAALKEHLDAHAAEFPPYEAGIEAQNAWAKRLSDAIANARAIIAKHSG